jgi:hypothetical protein
MCSAFLSQSKLLDDLVVQVKALGHQHSSLEMSLCRISGITVLSKTIYTNLP